MRCPQDGVCWQAVGKRSLEGAYRRGDKEFKFDAVFSPGRSFQTSYRDEWSYRLMDQQGIVFFTAVSSNPPNGWSDNDKGQDKLPSEPTEHMQYLRERNQFAKEMASAVNGAEGPGGKLDAPWQQLCRHLTLSFVQYGQDAAMTPPPQEPESAQGATESSSDQTLTSATESDGDGGQWTGEGLLDDMESHEELAEGVLASEHDFDALGDDASASHDVAPSDPSILAFGRQKNKHTHPAEMQRVPGFEFQQDLQLYWKHTRSFLIGGWKTGKHHTAACINVKKRPLNSNDEWEVYERVCTENHGSKAGEGDMQLYANCFDMPVTKEWFVWKGECGGKYPTHFCNDDTALQIRHAYGLYDDGKKCLKRKRTHRPWCEQPW